jgi:hypothetical protein
MQKRKFIYILKANIHKETTFGKRIVDVIILNQILQKYILKRIINRIISIQKSGGLVQKKVLEFWVPYNGVNFLNKEKLTCKEKMKMDSGESE